MFAGENAAREEPGATVLLTSECTLDRCDLIALHLRALQLLGT